MSVTSISVLEDPAVAERSARSRVREYYVLAASLAPVLVLYLAALVAPLPYAPTHPDVMSISMGPSWSHIFGTDASGFDIFSRTIRAARVDLPLAVGGTFLAAVVGVPVGLVASAENWGSNVIMRVVDAIQSLPLLIVALAIVALAGNHIGDVLLAIVLIATPVFIRLVRSGAIVIRNSRYVEAAVASGASPTRILRVHILPNVMTLVLTQFTIGVATSIVVIAGLNFLGVGVSPPTPTWGSMISTGAGVIDQGQWWVAVFPGLAILVIIVCFNSAARALEQLGQAR